MTTEEDFQAALDANPDDHTTRLVFADWLEEQGDPRAEGYRALGCGGFYTPGTWFNGGSYGGHKPFDLPEDWFMELDWVENCSAFALLWCNYRSRRNADDAAALAFAKLAPERRAELLKGVLV